MSTVRTSPYVVTVLARRNNGRAGLLRREGKRLDYPDKGAHIPDRTAQLQAHSSSFIGTDISYLLLDLLTVVIGN
jgi:hypothetical protein